MIHQKYVRLAKSIIGATAAFMLSSVNAAEWNVPAEFPTIQEAIDSPNVIDGDVIRVGPGSHAGALLTKRLTINGEGGAVINDGPPHGSGLIQGFRLRTGSDGATISHLEFQVDLAIMNGDGVDNVTVNQCTFINAIQAISNWRGSAWEISHNVITDLRTSCGGGIGILVGDYMGGVVSDNVVSHNKINGTVHVSQGDCGGYNASGIVIYADFRGGRLGAKDISFNRVVKNHVSLTSDTPTVVDAVAFELTDTRNDENLVAIHDNAIGFNDFRGSANQIDLTPGTLSQLNSIARNFGENRANTGVHPSVFGPGGN